MPQSPARLVLLLNRLPESRAKGRKGVRRALGSRRRKSLKRKRRRKRRVRGNDDAVTEETQPSR